MEFVRNPKSNQLVLVGSSEYKGLVKRGIVFERPKVPNLVVRKGNKLHIRLPSHIVKMINNLVSESSVEYGGQLDFDYGGLLESITIIRGTKTNVSLVDMGDFEVLWHIHQESMSVSGDNPPSLADMRALIAMKKQYSLIFTPNAIYMQYLLLPKYTAIDRWNMLMKHFKTINPNNPVRAGELYVVKHLRSIYPNITMKNIYETKYRAGRLGVFANAVGIGTKIFAHNDQISFVVDIYEPKKVID